MNTADRTLDIEALLAPVPGASPAGRDLRYSGEYDKLKAARRLADDRQQGRAASGDPDDNLSPEDRAAAAQPLWTAVTVLASGMLTSQSKDIQVAVWLLEAETYANGFRGALSALELLRRLLETYWDGLLPPIEEGDDDPLALRAGVMESINQRLPPILAGLPLAANSRKYSLASYQLAKDVPPDKREELIAAGRPLPEQFTSAIGGSRLEHLQTLSAQLEACANEVAALEQVTDQRFAGLGLSFGAVRKTLEEIQFHVGRALRAKLPRDVASTGGAAAAGMDADAAGRSAAATADGVWSRALELVSQGQLEGLRLAQAHIEAAPSGRERFLRQLQLSELCLQAGMHAFAYPILDELGKTIDARDLLNWEDASVIRRTWAGLSTACELLGRIRPESVQRQSDAQQRLSALGVEIMSMDGSGDAPLPES
jgi:type VI secretion system protein ImpA